MQQANHEFAHKLHISHPSYCICSDNPVLCPVFVISQLVDQCDEGTRVCGVAQFLGFQWCKILVQATKHFAYFVVVLRVEKADSKTSAEEFLPLRVSEMLIVFSEPF